MTLLLETDPATVAERMQSAQIASVAIFVVLVVGLALVLRALNRKARREEEAERLARAFQEIRRGALERTPMTVSNL